MGKAAKVCAKPGCPQIVPAGRECPVHPRPSSTARGYDGQHRSRRANDLRALAERPGRPCPWCGTAMHVGMALDWDHTQGGLTCARCNRADGGRRAHQN